MTPTLIARLQAASEGSRELDFAMFMVLHPKYGGTASTAYGNQRGPTRSIDAIVALIGERLPGWQFMVAITDPQAWLQHGDDLSTLCDPVAKTAPLALCCALLMTLEG